MIFLVSIEQVVILRHDFHVVLNGPFWDEKWRSKMAERSLGQQKVEMSWRKERGFDALICRRYAMGVVAADSVVTLWPAQAGPEARG
ncbi:hypothetical protein FHR56_000900 [Xanthomonas sacchari]|uniref:hypothetical protein n=1 Tax=unclassified Xanthomonas TaxID=2643310 RepID=UPI00136C4D6F|nr:MULTISPECIES: hypothetical protein [unclassified Xanthomonas]MBB6365787.1 hypothetical protein [Xanthomonas sp. F10]